MPLAVKRITMKRTLYLSKGLLTVAALAATHCGGQDHKATPDAPGGTPQNDAATLIATPALCEFVAQPRETDLQLIAANGAACVNIARTAMCPGDICKAVPYRVDRLLLIADGQKRALNDSNNFKWTESHHNWNDSGRFIDGDVTIELIDRTYEDLDNIQSKWDLIGKRNGQMVWGPVRLAIYVAP